MSTFHYSNDGKEVQGPCDLDYIKYLFHKGTLARTAVLSPVNSGTWIPIREYLEATEAGVTVKDIKMPFLSMVVFMVKWAVAAIPAIIILWTLAALLIGIFGALFASLFTIFN